MNHVTDFTGEGTSLQPGAYARCPVCGKAASPTSPSCWGRCKITPTPWCGTSDRHNCISPFYGPLGGWSHADDGSPLCPPDPTDPAYADARTDYASRVRAIPSLPAFTSSEAADAPPVCQLRYTHARNLQPGMIVRDYGLAPYRLARVTHVDVDEAADLAWNRHAWVTHQVLHRDAPAGEPTRSVSGPEFPYTVEHPLI